MTSSSSSSLTPGRSPELRKDPTTNHWVIFSPARAKRPSDFKSKNPTTNPNPNNSTCPFCAGNEHLCAPEIFRLDNNEVSGSWNIRVIQNLYPALSRDNVEPIHRNEGDQVSIGGFGFHDVVIESPSHEVQLADLEAGLIAQVLMSYKKIIERVKTHDSIKYAQVFKNHGASAGASLSHTHSQILSLPVIPPKVAARMDAMKEYFNEKGKCNLCQVQPSDLIINESRYFISIVPFAASFPFEMWIIPRDHSSHFHEIDPDKAIDLGGLLKLMLKKMSLQLNNPPFNFMIQTSPLQIPSSELPYAHWFLQIVPQLSTLAGFEMGSGCYINPVFPEDAAKVLRELDV
ncbi:hypothetical protein ACFE04_026959 [Oxalis oulophora]